MQVVIHVDADSAESKEYSFFQAPKKSGNKLQPLTYISSSAASSPDGIKAVRPRSAPPTPPAATGNATRSHMSPTAETPTAESSASEFPVTQSPTADRWHHASVAAAQPGTAPQDLAVGHSTAAAHGEADDAAAANDLSDDQTHDSATVGIPFDAQESSVAVGGISVDVQDSNTSRTSNAHASASPSALPSLALLSPELLSSELPSPALAPAAHPDESVTALHDKLAASEQQTADGISTSDGLQQRLVEAEQLVAAVTGANRGLQQQVDDNAGELTGLRSRCTVERYHFVSFHCLCMLPCFEGTLLAVRRCTACASLDATESLCNV